MNTIAKNTFIAIVSLALFYFIFSREQLVLPHKHVVLFA